MGSVEKPWVWDGDVGGGNDGVLAKVGMTEWHTYTNNKTLVPEKFGLETLT